MENSQNMLESYGKNPEEARKLFAAIAACKDKQGELTDLQEIIVQMRQIEKPAFAQLRPHFERLLACPSLRRYFELHIESSQASDMYQAQGAAIDNDVMQGLQVIDTPAFAVVVAVAHPTAIAHKKFLNRNVATSVQMTPHDMVVRFLSGSGRVSVYSCEPIDDEHPASRNSTCWKSGEIDVADGQSLVLRAGQDSFSFDRVDSAVCFAQAFAKAGHACVMPEFDASSLKLIGVSAGTDKSSRIQLMSSIVRIFGHAEAFETVARFVQHPDYFVRWYVARELLAMNIDRAKPIIAQLAHSDTHPQVRAAAQQTLQLLTPQAA